MYDLFLFYKIGPIHYFANIVTAVSTGGSIFSKGLFNLLIACSATAGLKVTDSKPATDTPWPKKIPQIYNYADMLGENCNFISDLLESTLITCTIKHLFSTQPSNFTTFILMPVTRA